MIYERYAGSFIFVDIKAVMVNIMLQQERVLLQELLVQTNVNYSVTKALWCKYSIT